jgi:hypothetical protein
MTDEELAAVIAAVQLLQKQTVQSPETETSRWKRAARLEAAGVQ